MGYSLFSLLVTIATIGHATAVETLWESGLYEQAYETISSCNTPKCLRQKGIACIEGYGVTVDVRKGLSLLKKAASEGDFEAYLVLAKHYEKQPEPNIAKIFTAYERAAPHVPEAAVRYAELAIANNFPSTLDLEAVLREAANDGHRRGQFLLAAEQIVGNFPTREGDDPAATLDALGDQFGGANLLLGQFFHKKREHAKAYKYFLLAEDYPLASAHLGFYAEHGIGRSRDKHAAFEYYQRAKSVVWAAEGLDRLVANAESVYVAGVSVHSVPRDNLRDELVAAGASRQASNALVDEYSISLEGIPTILRITHLPGPPFYSAEVKLTMKSEDRTESRSLEKSLRKVLNAKYGRAVKSSSKTNGDIWKGKHQSTVLEVQRRNGTISVTHRLAPNWNQLQKHLAEARSNKEGLIENAL